MARDRTKCRERRSSRHSTSISLHPRSGVSEGGIVEKRNEQEFRTRRARCFVCYDKNLKRAGHPEGAPDDARKQEGEWLAAAPLFEHLAGGAVPSVDTLYDDLRRFGPDDLEVLETIVADHGLRLLRAQRPKRVTIDVDTTVTPAFGHQEGAVPGSNPRITAAPATTPTFEANEAALLLKLLAYNLMRRWIAAQLPALASWRATWIRRAAILVPARLLRAGGRWMLRRAPRPMLN
jgi:hypothetical protein